ncbi:Senescence/dehydration-associated protein, chloroplastic [Glycine max]|nr:Senescence/dehydration-associated protein, chloroplastic [Glycine max]
MASQNPNQRNSLYPQVIDSNPDAPSPLLITNHSSSSQPCLYPSVDYNDLVENLFSEDATAACSPSAPPEATEEVLFRIPGAILNLVDKDYSVELACGDFSVIRLRQGDNAVAVYARVADEIQWPLAKDAAAVKLDDSHYFFSFRVPKGFDPDEEEDVLSYGLTIASKGQERLVKDLDAVLENCSCFSVQSVSENAKKKGEALDGTVASEVSPKDMESGKKKEMMEERCAAYWTTLAPNVEDYSGKTAKMIAAGSGHVVKGILWCGDVTVDRLKWGNQVMKKRIAPGSHAEVSKVCDAVEVTGKNVMSTSSTVTTELVDHRYGEQAAEATSEGFSAAGHALGTAWAAFKIRKALNPKSVLKPTSLAKAGAKAAASEFKSKNSK